MKRLTEKIGNTNCVKGCGSNCKYGFQHCRTEDWENCKTIDDVIDKLAQYEDLEEQGLLLRLPCKVGNTVYSIANDGKIYPVKATREVRIVDGVLHIICESCKYSDLVSYDDIGKTVFLTQAEAEAKLKELKGGENE